MNISTELERAGEILSPAVLFALELLEERTHLQDKRIVLLEEENRTLRDRVRDLEARLAGNSTNSSRPPSSDPPGTLRPKKRRSGKKRGGQPGHKGTCRSLLPLERVDHFIPHRPSSCRRCGHSLAEAVEVGTRGRHQIVELPEIGAHVIEHQMLTLGCPNCGQHTRAPLPAELRRRHFGPRLVAFAATLTSRFRLSRRLVTELFRDLLDVPQPSIGTIQAMADETSAATLDTFREIRCHVRASPTLAVDETGWKLREHTRWVWAAVAPTATYFRIAPSRAGREREALLGRDPPGVITTDRWRAYDGHPLERRQLCWAHLMRNFQGVADAGGAGAALGNTGVAECERLFSAWRRYSTGELSHAELRLTIKPLRARFRRLLTRGEGSPDRRARALTRDLLRLWPALWTFLGTEGVEPTSNAAERALRKPVIQRKITLGSNSGKGLRFTERMLSISETCRQSQIHLQGYLERAIVSHRRGDPTPRLLPIG